MIESILIWALVIWWAGLIFAFPVSINIFDTGDIVMIHILLWPLFFIRWLYRGFKKAW